MRDPLIRVRMRGQEPSCLSDAHGQKERLPGKIFLPQALAPVPCQTPGQDAAQLLCWYSLSTEGSQKGTGSPKGSEPSR
jgi:hypothetical protein